jgi:flagellar biogenesis protein FliO
MARSRLRLSLAHGALCYVLLLPAALAQGQSSSSGSLGFSGAPTAGAGSMIQMFGYVLAIVMIVGAVIAFFLRSGGLLGIRLGAKTNRKLQLQETWMLGHKQFLAVVDYEGRKMLLGVCPGRIDYLCPLEGNEDAVGTENAPDFQQMLARKAGQPGGDSQMNMKTASTDAKGGESISGKDSA